ncbi:MAG: HAD family hydrolase [Marinifilaceae bacterium]
MRDTLLFDFDGVIVDTEGEYDKFWNRVNDRLQLGYENFARKIKGLTAIHIRENYLSDMSSADWDLLMDELHNFEMNMPISFIPGAEAFLQYCRANNYQIGLVTSSGDVKVERALNLLGYSDFFDTMVTAQSITHGKPNPMCYCLAAQRLNRTPGECIVFEDSFMGIEAGIRAEMPVIAIATTNMRSDLKQVTPYVVSDFTETESLNNFLKLV